MLVDIEIMQSINIFAVPNGVGISRDIDLIKQVLVNVGYEVHLNHIFRYTPRRKYDLSIHLERFRPELFTEATKNIMIPNPEWFEGGWMKYLSMFDAIFTKSQAAEQTFKKLGCTTHFISFTSEDRWLKDVKKDDFHWFHCAGKSVQKQTEVVLKTWAKNPGFPHINILQDPKFYRPRTILKNVNYMYDRVDEHMLKTMQNVCGVHVCPSESEGFGHYIVEAMSCGAIVITTNGAPMNELITPDRGVLCPVNRSEAVRLSTRYVVNEECLEKAVTQTMVLDDAKKANIRKNARDFFEENDRLFREKLPEAVKAVLESAKEK